MMKSLRQFLFDPELRIPEPDEGDMRPLMELLGANGGLAARDLYDMVADIAAWSWEISQETERFGAGTPAFLRRAVEGLGAALQDHDVKIQDFSGKDYDIHENWDRVISAPREKRRPYIARMRVPRIFFRGELLKGGVPVVEDREEEP